MATKLKRTTIKLPGDVYLKLQKARERSGVPITNLIRLAVFAYLAKHHRGPGRPPGKLRGSR